MYENLHGRIIDKSNPEFADVPYTLAGEIFLGGSKATGWNTKPGPNTPKLRVPVQQSDLVYAGHTIPARAIPLVQLVLARNRAGIMVPVDPWCPVGTGLVAFTAQDLRLIEDLILAREMAVWAPK